MIVVVTLIAVTAFILGGLLGREIERELEIQREDLRDELRQRALGNHPATGTGTRNNDR